MMVARKKKPPIVPKQHWLSTVVAGMATIGGTIGTVATPDNIAWLMSHGGKLFSVIAACLAIANCVKIFRNPKQP